MKNVLLLLFMIVTICSSNGSILSTIECQTICTYKITAASAKCPNPCSAAAMIKNDGKSGQCMGNFSVDTRK